MINLTAAYVGAMKGLHNNPIFEARDTQKAICKQLALMRPRGTVVDSDKVTDEDMQHLKQRGEVRLK